ncbi:MAG: hypothetical protein IPP71_10175 [Bacteroidetes bacterium]|nr:hypothetical protein [Bacteroidota bacterium]
MKKILCIHGIGKKDATMEDWAPEWEHAISQYSKGVNEELKFEFLRFDDIFEKYEKRNGIRYVETIAKLIRDWIYVSVLEMLVD